MGLVKILVPVVTTLLIAMIFRSIDLHFQEIKIIQVSQQEYIASMFTLLQHTKESNNTKISSTLTASFIKNIIKALIKTSKFDLIADIISAFKPHKQAIPSLIEKRKSNYHVVDNNLDNLSSEQLIDSLNIIMTTVLKADPKNIIYINELSISDLRILYAHALLN